MPSWRETIHLLAPTGAKRARAGRGARSSYHTTDPAYLGAARCVDEFLALHPGGVRTLREIEPCFAKMTAEMICGACPNVAPRLAAELCAPFGRGDGIARRLPGATEKAVPSAWSSSKAQTNPRVTFTPRRQTAASQSSESLRRSLTDQPSAGTAPNQDPATEMRCGHLRADRRTLR
jgi:hypothetical protein